MAKDKNRYTYSKVLLQESYNIVKRNESISTNILDLDVIFND